MQWPPTYVGIFVPTFLINYYNFQINSDTYVIYWDSLHISRFGARGLDCGYLVRLFVLS